MTDRILRRCIEMYDKRRAWFREETESTTRHVAIDWLSRTAGIDYVPAAELLADALARRACERAEGPALRATKRQET